MAVKLVKVPQHTILAETVISARQPASANATPQIVLAFDGAMADAAKQVVGVGARQPRPCRRRADRYPGHLSFTRNARCRVSGMGRAASAATAIRECRRALAASGSTIAREAIGKAGKIADWRHYPDSDVYDAVSHAQYFYHRHAAAERMAAEDAGEHGHFHLFLRAEGMPRGAAPLLLPEAAIANLPTPPQAAPSKRGARDEVSHLVAIAIDKSGEPVRLFTTNRWVTGETWYRADDVIRMLDRFSLDAAEPASVVNRWLAAIVRLYQPEIAMLLAQARRGGDGPATPAAEGRCIRGSEARDHLEPVDRSRCPPRRGRPAGQRSGSRRRNRPPQPRLAADGRGLGKLGLATPP